MFAAYRSWLKDRNAHDLGDPGGLLLEAVQRNGGVVLDALRHDHVFVDEVQDFNLSWLVALVPRARKSLTLAGDLAQRIYRRNFTWRSAGINVLGRRSKRLSGSFRTTAQIMRVAQHLADNADVKKMEDYVEPTIPDRQGPPVRRIIRETWWDAMDDAVALVPRIQAGDPSGTIVVSAPFGKSGEKLVRKLGQAGVRAEFVKGRKINPRPGLVLVTTWQGGKGAGWRPVATSPAMWAISPTSQAPTSLAIRPKASKSTARL